MVIITRFIAALSLALCTFGVASTASASSVAQVSSQAEPVVQLKAKIIVRGTHLKVITTSPVNGEAVGTAAAAPSRAYRIEKLAGGVERVIFRGSVQPGDRDIYKRNFNGGGYNTINIYVTDPEDPHNPISAGVVRR